MIQQKFVALVTTAALAVIPVAATMASDFLSGTIEVVRADNYDVGGVFIRVSGAMSGTQACPLPDGSSQN